MPPTRTADETAAAKYFHAGAFRHSQFRADFAARFSKIPHFNSASIDQADRLLGSIESDARVTDIRWMAYMMATAYWETSHLEKVSVPVTDKKTHQPKTAPNGSVVMREVKVWRNMAPVDESDRGKGRAYFLPVKVRKLPDGSAIVTEHDGDQWTVSLDGKAKPANKGAKLGAPAAGREAKLFTDDAGTENAYYGRGLVQLTWWNNYASTGAAIGYGLELLFHPERVKEPDIAYAIMSHGMITGAGFANGHKLSTYFHGAHTDYVHARRMVNGSDHDADIAKIAEAFAGILLGNKVTGLPAVQRVLP